ncbi:MAG: biotin/lipoate A/B protein ligase family protein [Bacillota bacterium]|nr:biotin/lipoate A/B protein ligase family protein [Bacillota bacterium]
MMLWRAIFDRPRSGPMNMAVDEAMLQLVGQGAGPPTLRLYGWARPTISLGYFQRAAAEVDLEACAADGVPVVRRPTGGRAVFHDDEVTYSIVIPQAMMPGSVLETYRLLSGGILQALAYLGLHGELATPAVRGDGAGATGRERYGGNGGHARRAPGDGMQSACFDSPSWYETLVGGRKIIGSAQTRQGGALLQHGSLLVGFDRARLAGLLRSGTRRDRDELAATLGRRVTSLEAEMGRRPSRREVQRALACGMARALSLYLVSAGYSAREREMARRLCREKYKTSEWTMRR